MHQHLWGYKVEEKIYLGVRERESHSGFSLLLINRTRCRISFQLDLQNCEQCAVGRGVAQPPYPRNSKELILEPDHCEQFSAAMSVW